MQLIKNVYTMVSDNTIFDLQQSHSDTDFVVKNANLELEVGADIFETVCNIPYVGSILKLGKVALSYIDYRFFRKLGRFLKYANEIPESEMRAFLDSISTEDKKSISDYLTQLLYTAEDDAKAELMGKIYKRRALGEIDNDMMLRLCSIVSRSFISDLGHLSEYLQVSENNTFITDNLVALGLLADSGNVYEESYNGFESTVLGLTKHTLNQVGITLYKIISDKPINE